MFCLNDTMRFFLCLGHTDMRKVTLFAEWSEIKWDPSYLSYRETRECYLSLNSYHQACRELNIVNL